MVPKITWTPHSWSTAPKKKRRPQPLLPPPTVVGRTIEGRGYVEADLNVWVKP